MYRDDLCVIESRYGINMTPAVGVYIQPDQWPFGETLIAADEFDRDYFGVDFRLRTNQEIIPSLPVKITVTGRKVEINHGQFRVRVKIEFVRDGEPSVFSGGWLCKWQC